MQNLNEMSAEELKDFILHIHEKYFVELKKAESELPRDFWPSYSAFSNTAGGIIILGVKENSPANEITGVRNMEKIQTNLWNDLSNPNKVNYRSIENQDVMACEIDGKAVILIRVREAPETEKPVYIGRLEETYIRTGDGDRRATPDQLAAFFRNAQPCQDNLPAEGFTLADLDLESVITFKERVNARYPQKQYMEMSHEQFLTEIGACYKDRNTGNLKIRKGALLFLGRCNAIKELFPHFHLDFFNRRGGNPRWIDRVSDDEPSDCEINIYNFYNIVYEKTRMALHEAFELDSTQQRIPVSTYDETLRECLINCLAHADYAQGYPGIKIEMFDGWFRFVNPGKMLVSIGQFQRGGDSRPRNEIVMKLFRLLGLSERQGFGGPLIYKSAASCAFRRPEIVTDLEKTELRIWNIDLADSYPDLTPVEKEVLRCIVKNNAPVSAREIVRRISITEYRTRKALQALETRGLIEQVGNGPATKFDIKRYSTEFLTQMQIYMDDVGRLLI